MHRIDECEPGSCIGPLGMNTPPPEPVLPAPR